MSDFENPYRPNEPVLDPVMLFGRQDVADWVERHIQTGERTLVIGAQAMVGKTSLVRHIGALQTLAAYNLVVTLLPPPSTREANLKRTRGKVDEAVESELNLIFQTVTNQLIPQLARLNLIAAETAPSSPQPATGLRALFTRVTANLQEGQYLVLYIDDLHLLHTNDLALLAGFLTALMPIQDDCPQLHFVLVGNQDKLESLHHPLVDNAPQFHLGTLTTEAALSMMTVPVKNVLRFDYGVTKRIVEVNSNHPYYLTLFGNTLLERQISDGWVNQRDFDSALAEILDMPIAPFKKIWEDASLLEQAVLAGMAGVQGTPGPLTHQEVVRALQRHESAVSAEVVIDALESLAERGVIVPMGAISYRFHVALLRYWLRERTNLPEILAQIDWNRVQAKPRPAAPRAQTPRRQEPPPRQSSRLVWPLIAGVGVVFLCLAISGVAIAVQFVSLPFLAEPTAVTEADPSPVEIDEAGLVVTTEPDAPTPTAGPSPTPTPTQPAVELRTLPAIAYMGRDVNQRWQIYLMNADGSEATSVTNQEANDTMPTWSPDGNRLAFVSDRAGNRDIYVMSRDGQNVVNLTRNPADDWTPAWSHDSTKLAFSSIRSGNWEIYTLDLACLDAPETCPTRISQITITGNDNLTPMWSPDDSRIAYSSNVNGNWDVFTMAADGTDARQITTAEGNDLAAVWSPDGSRLAFESDRDGNVEIYMVSANGGDAQNVTNFEFANDHGPTWSPDGQRLIFYANREGNWDIFAITLDGQTLVNLTQSPNRDEQTPAWRP